MAQTVDLWGATYSNVPAVNLPKSPSGTARFTDTSVVTASASDVRSGKTFVTASGEAEPGSLVISTYYVSASAPSSSQGSNGDIWLVTS